MKIFLIKRITTIIKKLKIFDKETLIEIVSDLTKKNQVYRNGMKKFLIDMDKLNTKIDELEKFFEKLHSKILEKEEEKSKLYKIIEVLLYDKCEKDQKITELENKVSDVKFY